MNHVELGGNLTRDVELRLVGANQTPLASFTIAFNGKPKEGKEKPAAQFFDCKAWRDVAEAIARDAGKGDRIEVSGMLTQETWEDKKDGSRRSKVVVLVFDYQLPSGGPRRSGGGQARTPAPAEQPLLHNEEDIPF